MLKIEDRYIEFTKTEDNYKRLRKKGCWSFCDKDCELEKIGACRTFIPSYEQPPPNQGCYYISDLVFGLRNYDKEILEWETKKNKSKKEIPDWRTELKTPDPFAMIPVYLCTDSYLKRRHIELWNPNIIEDMIFHCNYVVDAVLKCQLEGISKSALSNLAEELLGMFHEFYIPGRKIQNERKSIRSFERAALIIARWCMENYYTDPINWSKSISRYSSDELSDKVKMSIDDGEIEYCTEDDLNKTLSEYQSAKKEISNEWY